MKVGSPGLTALEHEASIRRRQANSRCGSDAVSKRGEGSYSFLSCVYEWRTMIALFS